MAAATEEVGGTRGFLPAVEGMRACAAMGVVLTHVAFQTGVSSGVTGRLLHRFDLAVAVFFALSGFLLWRGHAAAARGLRRRPPTGHYLRSRLVRIMPGYLVAVVIILTLLPDANHASPTVWWANLTLTQVYVPLTLTGGLTQMWSLSVEVSFYLALPILALSARLLPVRARVPVIAAIALASLWWGLLPIHTAQGVNFLNWPPAYASWFAAGMLLAEWTVSPPGWAHKLARNRWAIGSIVMVAYFISASPLAGPEGLVPGAPEPIHHAHVDGRGDCARIARPAGPGPTGNPAPDPGQPGDGDAGPMVLRTVRLAPGGAGDGVPDGRQVHVQREFHGDFDTDADLRLRDGRSQLCADRVSLPKYVAPLGIPTCHTGNAGPAATVGQLGHRSA